MFDINEVYDTIDNYKSYIYFATAYCKVNELQPLYPGTVVRVVPVTGNLPRSHISLAITCAIPKCLIIFSIFIPK